MPATIATAIETPGRIIFRCLTFDITGWRGFIAPVRVDGWVRPRRAELPWVLLRQRAEGPELGHVVFDHHVPNGEECRD